MLSIIVNYYNPRIQEAEARRPRVQVQPGIHSNMLWACYCRNIDGHVCAFPQCQNLRNKKINSQATSLWLSAIYQIAPTFTWWLATGHLSEFLYPILIINSQSTYFTPYKCVCVGGVLSRLQSLQRSWNWDWELIQAQGRARSRYGRRLSSIRPRDLLGRRCPMHGWLAGHVKDHCEVEWASKARESAVKLVQTQESFLPHFGVLRY